jgi:NAD(P)-dependent dehydrogenase (short-subunit alcohol dehydrogenase family)
MALLTATAALIEEPTVRILTAAEMVGAAQPVTWHWPGWVAAGDVALITGAGGTLKSWLAQALAIAAAAGLPALPDEDEGSMVQGSVLVISAEQRVQEDSRRFRALAAGLSIDPSPLPITFLAGSFNFTDPKDQVTLAQQIELRHPSAVVIDNAIAVSDLENENDNAEVRRFMRLHLLPLSRRLGLTVYLLHHSPKPSLQPGARLTDELVARGASDWRNSVDVGLYLKSDPGLGTDAVILSHFKAPRSGVRHAPIWFQLQDVETGGVRLVYGGRYSPETGEAKQAALKQAIEAAVELLKGMPGGLEFKALKEQLAQGGMGGGTAQRACNVLRGIDPWPHGDLKGSRQPIVTEFKRGRLLVLRLSPREILHPDDPSNDREPTLL